MKPDRPNRPDLPLAFRHTDVSTRQERYWYICFVEEDWYIAYYFNETTGQVEDLSTHEGRNATDFYKLHPPQQIPIELFWSNLL